MKYLILSDLHGSTSSLIYKDLIKKMHFDKIILLGDILYHGPRNDLPNDYAPKTLMRELNEIKDDIIAIKGNCDAEVDEMVLDFKLEQKLDLNLNGLKCHLEHGHHLDDYHSDNVDLIMYGHTHLLRLERVNNIIYFNPGSIALPKNNNPKTFGVMDDDRIIIYDINMKIIKELEY